MIGVDKCDAHGMLLRHFEDMYGPLGRAARDRLARAERGARSELDERCRRRAVLRAARRDAVSERAVVATER